MKFYPKIFKSDRKNRFVRQKYILITAIVFLTIAVISGCTSSNGLSQVNSSSDVMNSDNPIKPPLSQPLMILDENDLVSLYERTMPSVVKVEAVIKMEIQTIGPFQFGPFQQEGQGSGFVIDEQGHILTNNHVIEGASSVTVTLYKGESFDAKVVGTDRENDLALLQIDSDSIIDVPPLMPGDSSKIKPGQMAIALGSPFGLDGSITTGIISAVGRSITSTTQRLITNVIQTDAAINPGNSGGPLLNSKGEVIGINTAIEASSTGIGFAVPINTAMSLLPALMEGGEVSSPWIGIEGTDINAELASKLDLTVDSGVYVIEVISGSPAEEAGLRGSGIDSNGRPTYGGDVIISVDEQVVTQVEDLVAYLNGKKPGDIVTLSIYRGDKELSINVTLGEWPEEAP